MGQGGWYRTALGSREDLWGLRWQCSPKGKSPLVYLRGRLSLRGSLSREQTMVGRIQGHRIKGRHTASHKSC